MVYAYTLLWRYIHHGRVKIRDWVVIGPHPGEYNCCFFVGGLEFLAANHGKRTSQIARNSRPWGLKPAVDHRKALAANRYVAEQLAACWRGETASLAWIDDLHMASYGCVWKNLCSHKMTVWWGRIMNQWIWGAPNFKDNAMSIYAITFYCTRLKLLKPPNSAHSWALGSPYKIKH